MMRIRISGACFAAALVMAATVAAPASAASFGGLAWGEDEFGQLGNGATTNTDVPVAISGLSGGATTISAGYRHSLALRSNGTVLAWGENSSGQLGNGTTTASNVPVVVSGLSGVTAISAGGGHSLALLGNGKVMAWGSNYYGQLGNASTENSDVPVEVHGLSGVTAISAGYGHSLALLSNGTVMSWGYNDVGQLGNATTENSGVPVAVSGLSGVSAVSAGGYHSLALLSGSTVMAWGYNRYGQLGNGSTVNSDMPVAVTGLTGVTAVSAGEFHSLGLLTAGTVDTWGNFYLAANNEVPTPVAGLSGVSGISAGNLFSLALLSNRTVMGWGVNESGQLGNASTTSSPTPVAVSELAGANAISAGGFHSLDYSPPPPTVTSVSPTRGRLAGGTSVSVAGTNFSGATAVKFGSAAATSFTVNSETSITAVSPAGTGTVDVTVTTPWGTSATSSADRFSYVHLLSEGLPELGRCVKVAAKTGEYRGVNCSISEPGKGTYDWLAGPGERKKFSATAGATWLETVGKSKGLIKCTASKFTGEYTGPKTETVTVLLSGCVSVGSGKTCQSSPSKPGEIETAQALEGELGFIRGVGVDPTVGWDLKRAPTLLTFTCGTAPESTVAVSIEGSVIAPVTPVPKMTSETTLKFTVVGGKQSPEHFEGGPKDTLTTTFISGAEKTVEQSGLRAKVLSRSEEPLEIKAECEGTGC